MTRTQAKRGFTLIELAVAIVIIGLIIGAVIKGQQMVADSRVRAVADQIEGLKTAVNTFQEKYGALPGDFSQAQARLAGCQDAGTNCLNGDGNGTLGDGTSLNATAISSESRMAWQHMAFANIISGVVAGTDASQTVLGENFPTARTGGGFVLVQGALQNPARSGLWLRLQNVPATASGTAGQGALTPAQAAEIDRRLDDGKPTTGFIRAEGVTQNCRPAGGLYDERVTSRDCDLYILVQ